MHAGLTSGEFLLDLRRYRQLIARFAFFPSLSSRIACVVCTIRDLLFPSSARLCRVRIHAHFKLQNLKRGAAPFEFKGAGFDFLRNLASTHPSESIPFHLFSLKLQLLHGESSFRGLRLQTLSCIGCCTTFRPPGSSACKSNFCINFGIPSTFHSSRFKVKIRGTNLSATRQPKARKCRWPRP